MKISYLEAAISLYLPDIVLAVCVPRNTVTIAVQADARVTLQGRIAFKGILSWSANFYYVKESILSSSGIYFLS